jgi:predicted metal-dependent hydrolase
MSVIEASLPETLPELGITPRNIDFDLDKSHINDWLGGSKERTLFMNALSMLFPVGERYFIYAVNGHRQFVTDPKLKAEVKAFTQQEGMHTREHIAYNEALQTVVDAAGIEKKFDDYVEFMKKTLGIKRSLLATCAFEHFTAILAEAVLDHPEYLAGAREDYARIWTWHALEELEHKAVAYDVFRAAYGTKLEWNRMIVMYLVTLQFFSFLNKRLWVLMKAQNLHRNPLSWAKLVWFMFGSPGIFRRIAPIYLKYYNPKFHPNDIDNKATLARTSKIVASWA